MFVMTKNKNQKETSKFVEDWLPIKELNNGLITVSGGNILEGDQIVTGVRIEPKNIFILDGYVQLNIIEGIRNFYNTLDYEFWIICCDRPVDINLYKSELEIMYNKCNNPQIRKMIVEDMDKCDMFIGPAINAVDTEYYLLFKHSAKDMPTIQKRVQNLISGLASAGMVSRKITDDDARVLLDSFFNDSKRVEFGTVMS